MAEKISTYRQVRLILQVPGRSGGRTYYSLHAVGVRRGVPTSTIVADGTVSPLEVDCSTEDMWAAIAAAVSQNKLHG